MRVVLLNDTDGRENIGCRLTSSTLKRYLSQGFKKQRKPIDIEPFPWKFGKGRKTGQVWMSGVFWMRSKVNSIDYNGFVGWLKNLSQEQYGEKAVKAAMNADLVIFHPEGSISNYHDSVRIMNLLCLPLLACIKGVPVYTMNGTFPLYSVTDRRFCLIQTFLHACHYSVLRDRLTARHYNVNFMPDSAIMHKPVNAVCDENMRPYVLITTGANLPKHLNRAIGREAIRFCDENRLKPLILTKKHKDLKSLKSEVASRGGVFLESATLEQAESWLAQCCMHIGGRYHMALFGLLLDIPSVLILTNTHKNKWLSEEFSGVELGSDPEDMLKKATNLYGQREETLSSMRKSVMQAQTCFSDELDMMIAAVNKRLHRETSATQIDKHLCLEVASQLSLLDFLSFWPLGVRLKITSGN